MSGHSTTLLFALTLYFTSPKKSQRGFGVYLQTQHKTGKCGISLFSMKISAIWEIKNLEIKKNKINILLTKVLSVHWITLWLVENVTKYSILTINTNFCKTVKLLYKKTLPRSHSSPPSQHQMQKKKKKNLSQTETGFFFPQCNMASSVMHTNIIKYKYGP